MKKGYCFLLEASGSLTAAYLIENIKKAKAKVFASDISSCYGRFLADGFLTFPRSTEPALWEVMEREIKDHQINVVIPSLDETLHQWSAKKEYFLKHGVHVILSDSETIEVCQDKWKTFQFFSSHNIPTPATSLNFKFPLVKQRLGRGGKGILVNPAQGTFSMDGMISQELLQGKEYTIDVFCDRHGDPVYIIPRLRLHIKDGKSLNGITVENSA
ncbi:MAG: ATP-grasp domain-containing protein, partial [Flavisolibacter sp.]|nr:ATP-grasp domain-containing protein [Flavisolibacter sp.]